MRIPFPVHPLQAPRWAAEALMEQLTRPAVCCAAVAMAILIVLGLDPMFGLGGQLALGAATWLLLAGCTLRLTATMRWRVATVVVVATGFELLASIAWGLYTYRLGNVPLFVPPGHGLVWLAGWHFARLSWVRENERLLRRGAAAVVAGWAVLGLTVLASHDQAGAMGALLLLPVLLAWRGGLVYVGVFAFVSLVELYGTAMGVWAWAPVVPYTGIESANPPSGVAAGYVVIESTAIAIAVAVSRLPRMRGPRARGASVAS